MIPPKNHVSPIPKRDDLVHGPNAFGAERSASQVGTTTRGLLSNQIRF